MGTIYKQFFSILNEVDTRSNGALATSNFVSENCLEYLRLKLLVQAHKIEPLSTRSSEHIRYHYNHRKRYRKGKISNQKRHKEVLKESGTVPDGPQYHQNIEIDDRHVSIPSPSESIAARIRALTPECRGLMSHLKGKGWLHESMSAHYN